MAEKIGTLIEGTKLEQLIIFNLGDEEYSVRIDDIREIISMTHITHIPDSPEFIKGVTNVRGDIVAIIDLRARFFLESEKEYLSKHIIITRQENNLYGLMVDEVTEVMRLPASDIKEAPDIISHIHEKYVSGVVTLGERLIILLNLAMVLSEEEIIELSHTAKKYYHKIKGAEQGGAGEPASGRTDEPGSGHGSRGALARADSEQPTIDSVVQAARGKKEQGSGRDDEPAKRRAGEPEKKIQQKKAKGK